MIRCCLLLLMVMLKTVSSEAQDYHAIQGSPYAGSLGVHNNPASIMMAPFKWDITLFGAQEKSSTNLLTIYNYSFLSDPHNSRYLIEGGDYKRHGNLSFNLNLLNARIALNRKTAIAFGINLKSYSDISTSSYNYKDTLHSTGNFFKINQPGNVYSAKFNSSGWAEIYASYAHTIIDNDAVRINGGITVKVNKGLSGVTAILDNASYQQVGDNRYSITNGYLQYIYSGNYDHWQKNSSKPDNINNFVRYAEGGVSFDAGIEYIIKPLELTNYDDEDNYYDYQWKFGVSLLDAGFTQYRSGIQSRGISGVKANITNIDLDTKFDSTVTSLRIFNDSISTIVNSDDIINQGYKIINPMRFVFNVDRFVYKNFYVNAELSVNVPSSWLNKRITVKDMNLLTITPRWETPRFGIYLPIQYTNTNNFWIGGAFKAGPLLIGVHNWVNLFSKTSVQNGGGYIALIIRDLQSISKKFDKRLNCPAM